MASFSLALALTGANLESSMVAPDFSAIDRIAWSLVAQPCVKNSTRMPSVTVKLPMATLPLMDITVVRCFPTVLDQPLSCHRADLGDR